MKYICHLDNKEFLSGDCYLREYVPIKIEYYELQIEIGEKESFYEGEQYLDVIDMLKDKGFTNISKQRADDLKIGLLAKPGAVKSVSINGNSDFSATDKFMFDAPVVIVVHTYPGKGYEDITVIAE